MAQLAVGDRAPHFKLQDQDGKIIDLADLKGKNVLLYFYPRADTPGCTIQACSIRDSSTELDGKGIPATKIYKDALKLISQKK